MGNIAHIPAPAMNYGNNQKKAAKVYQVNSHNTCQGNRKPVA